MTDDPVLSHLSEAFAEPQEETPEQPRDDNGQFTSTEEVPAETVETPAEPQLILGKYKDTEALAEAYENLQRDHGRLAQEVGDLRKQTPAEPLYDFSGADEQIAVDPQVAVQVAKQAYDQALRTGNWMDYERVIQSWDEVDPLRARRFDQAVQFDQLTTRLQPQLQTAETIAQRNAHEEALNTIASQHTDFAEVVGAIDIDSISERAQSRPALRQALNAFAKEGTRESAEALFDTLYAVGKADQADNVRQATDTVSAQQEQADREAKVNATVANSSTTPVVEESADPTLDKFYEFMRQPSATNWLSGR